MKLNTIIKPGLAVLCLFAAMAASAQDYSLRLTSAASSTSTKYNHKYYFSDTSVVTQDSGVLYITNNSPSPIRIYYEILQDNFDSTGWSYSVCNPEQCHYAPDIPQSETITIDTKPLNNGLFNVGVEQWNYAKWNKNHSKGTIRLRFYELGYSDKADTLTVTVDLQHLGIKESQQLAKEISVFPNPAVNTINISLANTSSYKPSKAAIFNISGQRVSMYDLTLSNLESIDVAGLANGLYMLQLIDRNGLSVNKLFTKE